MKENIKNKLLTLPSLALVVMLLFIFAFIYEFAGVINSNLSKNSFTAANIIDVLDLTPEAPADDLVVEEIIEVELTPEENTDPLVDEVSDANPDISEAVPASVEEEISVIILDEIVATTSEEISTITDETDVLVPEEISTTTIDQVSTTTEQDSSLASTSDSSEENFSADEQTDTPASTVEEILVTVPDEVITTIPKKINIPLVVSSISSPILGGTFHSGVIPVVVVFNKEVIVSGKPKLILTTGEPNTTAVDLQYHFGNRLYFLYKIIPGNSADPLDYDSSSALVLNGARITDTSGNTADVTLPNPGSAGSLSGRGKIIIETTN